MTKHITESIAPFAAHFLAASIFIHWSRLTISLALIVVVVLANIITRLIVGGGTWYRYADSVTGNDTSPKKPCQSEIETVGPCECRCHHESMFPGMICLDCYGLSCTEGRDWKRGA